MKYEVYENSAGGLALIRGEEAISREDLYNNLSGELIAIEVFSDRMGLSGRRAMWVTR